MSSDSAGHSIATAIRRLLPKYLIAVSVTTVCTAAANPFYPGFSVTNIAMLYLLGTTLIALRLGRGPAVFASVLNILVLDYLFIPPVLSFEIEDLQYVFTLAVMLVVAIVIANLVVTIQRHRDQAVAREQRNAILYALSRELCVVPDAETMVGATIRHVGQIRSAARSRCPITC